MRGACELIGLAANSIVRNLHTQFPNETGWAVLQVDLSNAFNCVSRDYMLRAFRDRRAEAAQWMASSYGSPAHLFCGPVRLLSHSGVQQGDNMGPAGFCFAVQDLLEEFGEMPDLLWQAWYMDDGTLIGSMPCLNRVVDILMDRGPSRGLFLNRRKCVLWGPGATPEAIQAHPSLRDLSVIPFHPGTGLRVLGVPVEHPSDVGTFTKAMVAKAVAKLDRMCSVLTRLPAAHIQYTLLRYCLDGCRLNFLTRCSSATHIGPLVTEADGILRRALGDVIGTPLTTAQWTQARLPQRFGGLGIRSPLDMGPPGRLASLVDFLLRGRKALELDEALSLHQPDFALVVEEVQARLGPIFEPLQSWHRDPSRAASADEVQARQHWWGERWYKAQAKALGDGLPARDQARVALQQSQRGAAWLAVSPSVGLGTELNNDECRLLLRFWLGAPLIPSQWQGAACPLCNQVLDTMGDHMVCCNKNDIKQRHSVLQGALSDLAQLAGVPTSLEVALPDGSVPGDVCFRQWDADGPLMVDITCRHPAPVGSAHGPNGVA